MPITILDRAEPLAVASRRGDLPILIGSDAKRILEHELMRYCEQKVTGRSFLISGHRGAGKTTLVHGAVQWVKALVDEAENKFVLSRDASLEGPPLRPLVVSLVGPNLLPPVAKPIAAGEGIAGDGEESSEEESEYSGNLETVLIQITLGLYRALADEFSRCYHEQVARRRTDPTLPPYVLTQLQEAAAQFELDLDQYPGSERLREYWRQAGALEDGILFRPGTRRRPGEQQGLRELVALSTACDAYKRISGKFSRKDESTSGINQTEETSTSIDAKTSELLKPLMSLLAGGAVATGALAAKADPQTSIFVGLLTALGSTMAFKYSRARTRQRGTNRADLFIPDLSVSTLHRVLPVLIERIHRAGLAPVFVVDELDKIDLSTRITETVKRLKKLVAERSFFCFLTDRRYFEEMIGRFAENPYPIEYTYFTNQLFIAFRHDDMRAYLKNVLLPAQPSQTATTSTPSSAVSPSGNEDIVDIEILPFIILHASRMHTIDVGRKLLALRDANGLVNLRPGEVRSRRSFRYELMMQVAVELILERPEVLSEVEANPAFRQIAHDAAYYISRQWRSAPEMLDLGSPIEPRFKAYLLSRMATASGMTNGSRNRQNAATGASEGDNGAPAARDTWEFVRPAESPAEERNGWLKIDPGTCTFLLNCVRELASLLAQPGDLRGRAGQSARYTQVVMDALPNEPLLQAVPGRDHVYEWEILQSGRPRPLPESPQEPQPPAPAAAEPDWKQDAALIELFEKKLVEISENGATLVALANVFGVLATTPAWTDTRHAIDRLHASERAGPYPDQEVDRAVVHDYAVMLEKSATSVALLIVCAGVVRQLGVVAGLPGRYAGMEEAMGVVSSAYRFRQLASQYVEGKLQTLYVELLVFCRDKSTISPSPRLENKSSAHVETWANWIRTTQASIMSTLQIPPDRAGKFKDVAWNDWANRLLDPSAPPRDPAIETVVCHSELLGPGAYLSFDLDLMTTFGWSLTLSNSLAARFGNPNLEPVPAWLAYVAMNKLGLDDQSIGSLESALTRLDSEAKDTRAGTRNLSRRTPHPAGIVVFKGSSYVAAWLPSASFPLIVLDSSAVQIFMQTLTKLGPGVADTLSIAFVAFEPSDATSVQLDPADLQVLQFFKIDPLRRIPLLGATVQSRSTLDSRYAPISARNAQELFAAVASVPGINSATIA